MFRNKTRRPRNLIARNVPGSFVIRFMPTFYHLVFHQLVLPKFFPLPQMTFHPFMNQSLENTPIPFFLFQE